MRHEFSQMPFDESTSPWNRTGKIEHSIALALCTISALVWPLYFIDLFPLSEARDWLGWWSNDNLLHEVIENLIARNTRFSRDFSMLTVLSIGRVCGASVLCVNVATLTPLVLSVAAYFQFVLAITGRAVVAAFVAAIFGVSLPLLVTASWQATIHDRIGIFFAFSTLTLAWQFRPDAKVSRLAVYSLTIALINFTALNCKEAYWFVPPATLLCHLHHAFRWTGRQERVRTAVVLAPLVCYSAWFSARYFSAGDMTIDWSHHVVMGNWNSNALAYASSAFGSVPIFGMLSVLLLGQVLRMWHQLSGLERWRLIWCVLVFGLAYFPIARTQYAAEYYLLAPMALFLAIVAVVVSNSFAQLATHQLAILTLAVAIIGVGKSLLSDASEFYRERRSLSRNFQDVMSQRSVVAESVVESGSLCLTAPPSQSQAYLFVDSQFAWDILRWNSKSELPANLRVVPIFRSFHAGCTLIQLNESLREKRD